MKYLLTTAVFLALLGSLRAAGTAPSPEQIQFFEKHIRPVLATKCYDCHSAKATKVKGGLLLDTRDGLLKGGDNGSAIVPGKPDASLLIQAIRYSGQGTQMPPQKNGGKLPDAVIASFEQWVRMGAPDPRVGAAMSVAERNREKAKQLWSFQPPAPIKSPTIKNVGWPRTQIDRFVLARMEPKGLEPGPDCEPRALLRRVYFDLIGLPPSPAEVDAFVAQCAKGTGTQQQALATIVDKLLQSPRYGERWARHWLDVARYAESCGKESNNLLPTAWRYRDYVIKAFNDDRPYDKFIREQIAGDLMPAKSSAEYNQNLIATAFLALGPKSLPERKPLQFTMDVVDEQIDVITRTVLGLSVACARCHDHMFDPVTTRDYYALAGILRSTQTFYGTHGARGRKNASTLLLLADESKPLAQQILTATDDLPMGTAAKVTLIKPNPKNKADGRETLPQKLMRKTMGVHDGVIADCPIYIRGELHDVGPIVPRGFVQALAGPKPAALSGSGRLQLAEWLTAKENPLTARVMANRVWQHLFGHGIVRTGDNFGATGERPTHPELLDHLALSFMENGWSVKKLVREMVLSRAYQLSTRRDAVKHQIDPGNEFLWRGNLRRLDAEAIRDGMLTVSGLMDLTPPFGSMVASAGDGRPALYTQTFMDAPFHYRSVYLPIVRDFPPSCLAVFDFAESSLVVPSRGVTNGPIQALYLMNSPFVIEQAKGLAQRIMKTPGLDHSSRVNLAYQYVLCRMPTDSERKRADQFLNSAFAGRLSLDKGGDNTAAELAYTTLCQSLLASAEFRYLADLTPSTGCKIP